MNKRQNYSRKREAILDTLRSTKTHPTAEWVYLQLKSQYPDLSLGTVYRNLSQFKEDGTIVSLGVVNGQEHFDGDISPHSHFICSHCGHGGCYTYCGKQSDCGGAGQLCLSKR